MLRASQVIELLGGAEAVADAVGITKNGVLRWTYAPETGGYGDFVPPRHWGLLVSFAEVQGKPVSLKDLAEAWAIRPPKLTSKRSRAAQPKGAAA